VKSTIRVCAIIAVALLPVTGAVGMVLAAASWSTSDRPAPAVAAPVPVPRDLPDRGGEATADLDGWVERVAGRAGLPARALQAYARADLRLRGEIPDCRLTWATLAGIGAVESDHGRHGGTELTADGRPSEVIIGIPLDGSPGIAQVSDTDGGALDGDTTYDRAVGPMQFIPGSWEIWGADADEDGRADPQDLDDAALAAGRYLCHDGRDLADGEDWWAAVLSYNHDTAYARQVLDRANDYAQRSGGNG
jgi:membrane-bound lytic murein transglycosylase B